MRKIAFALDKKHRNAQNVRIASQCEGYPLGCNKGAAAVSVMSADRVTLIIPQ